MRSFFRRQPAGLLAVLSVCSALALHPLLSQAGTGWVGQLSDWASTPSATSTDTAAPAATAQVVTATSPLPPSNLVGSFDGKQSVKLTWRDNANNEGYQQVWYSKDNAVSWTRMSNIAANLTMFTHNLGAPPTVPSYIYTVRAVNSYGISAFSNRIRVLTPVTTTQPAPSPSTVITAVLGEVNKFRAQNGLPALRLDDRLDVAAQRHSDNMASNSLMSHNCADGTTFSQRITQAGYVWHSIAENVAAGQTTPQQVVTAWINSPGHRANMLKTDVKDAGVGFNKNYWTLDLGG